MLYSRIVYDNTAAARRNYNIFKTHYHTPRGYTTLVRYTTTAHNLCEIRCTAMGKMTQQMAPPEY